MKTSVFILLVFAYHALALNSYSQATKLNIDLKDVTVKDVLTNIESQSEFYFMYEASTVDVNRKVSILVEGKVINEILDELFEGANVDYKINNRQIALRTNEVTESGDQQITVSGVVTDTGGEPLPGVSVVIKGTTQGTITDFDGKYSLPNVPGDAILQYSFVGMKAHEISVNGRTTIDIEMIEETIGLEEVVAIGYGTIRKSDLTGSVSSVKANEILDSPIQSIDQGLIGKSSGVNVTQTSGAPGAIASIRIRGTSSLEGGNEPLYVIDGFPMFGGAGISAAEGGGDNISALSTLNPNDIENIEILKDASATAIYGARAANGVVLITTKGGKRGTDQISVEVYRGVQSVVQKVDVMNAFEYATLVNEAYTNDGLNPIYNSEQMAAIQANPEGTNWQDEVFRSAPIENYQLTFSGGDQKNLYAISANYFNQDGIILNTNFKRYSGRVNLDRQINDYFKVGTHSTITRTINNAAQTAGGNTEGTITGALKMNPVQPVYANDEKTEYTLVNSPGLLVKNPVATAKEMVNETSITRVLSDVYGEVKFLDHFTGKVSFGADLMNSKFNNYVPSNIYQSGGLATAQIVATQSTTWLNENTLSYLNTINDVHSISGVVGMTMQGNRTEFVRAGSQDFVNDILQENNLASGATYTQPGSSATEWSLLSFLGRINYTYNHKYLFSVNGRIDGSSRFGENNKYAYFPSGSFAWRANEEDFIKDLNIFSNLKIRTSYGFTGNQEIGLYNSLATLASNTYYFGGAIVTGFQPDKVPNPDLRWEKTGQFDIGLDMGFFNNRINVTADYYNKKTTDILYSTAIPYVSGFSVALQNIGSIRNRGFELSIESRNIEKRNFSWSTNFNISTNKNKVLELGGEEYKEIGTGDDGLKTGSIHRLILGQPLGLFYGYVSDGLFQSEEEAAAGPLGPTNWAGGRKYKDLSGPDGVPDGVIDATYDRQVIGNPNPDFIGGMTNNLKYGNLSLSVFMQWSYGGDLFNYNSIDGKLASGGQNVYRELSDRWSTTNTDAKYPKATTNRSNQFSDFFMEDGSYLKIKTITLTYNFSNLKSGLIKNFEVYGTLNNFFTFTNYTGYDPEVSYRGASNLEIGEDFGGYPQAKSVTLGLRMNL